MRSVGHLTPRYVVNRLLDMRYQASNPTHPWLTPDSIHLLEALIKPTDVGVEYGSGRSTQWFAKRVANLISVETSDQWFGMVSKKLDDNNVMNVDYRFVDGNTLNNDHLDDYVQAIQEQDDCSIDFALIDAVYRDHCAYHALSKIKTGGLLIIDNANRYLPCRSYAPSTLPEDAKAKTELWEKVLHELESWRKIWTTNGVTDTAIFIKRHGC